METTKKWIEISAEARKELIGTFKVNAMAVSRALNYETNSGMAMVLRAAALERGGLVIDGAKINGYVPSCWSDGIIYESTGVFEFENGARLEWVRGDDAYDFTLIISDKETERYKGLRAIDALMMLLWKAENANVKL